MIVRNDDILNETSAKKMIGKEFDRFKFIHRMIMETDSLVHMPTILCTEIEMYPEAIQYIENETAAARMCPQLHGWEHKDYVHLAEYEIVDMLEESLGWFEDNLNTQFTIWATPWGGTSELAVEVCTSMGIELQTTNSTITPGEALRIAKADGEDTGQTILHHWWDRGLNLFRLCEVLKHGSYEAAAEADERGWF